MQFFQVHQGLLSVSIAMITISLTAGLNCSKCVDVRNVQVLKNTVSGFTFTVDPANIPTSQLCESVKNGEVAAGVSVVECPKNSPDNSSSSQEFRCVHYSGTLDMSLTLDLGSTSGEIKVRYEGTYRDCILEYVSESGFCTNQKSILPKDDKLRAEALSTLPLASPSIIVEFDGKKCVSDNNGTFFAVFKPNSKAVFIECNLFAIAVNVLVIIFTMF